MRTTLDLDDDVLFAARAVATREKRSLGSVISELAREALQRRPSGGRFAVLPARKEVVTAGHVCRLMDAGGA